MKTKNPLKWTIRGGVPVLAVIGLLTTIVAAAVIANRSFTTTVTIGTNGNFSLFVYDTATSTCTSTPFSISISDSGTGFNALYDFCIRNNGNAVLYFGSTASMNYNVTSGTLPTGATAVIADTWLQNDLNSPNHAVWSSPIGGSMVMTYVSQFGTGTYGATQNAFEYAVNIPASAPAGSYSWTITLYGFSTSTG